MHLLKVRNVQQALPDGIDLLIRQGYERDSRYGRVIKMDGPVATEYNNPQERVLFFTERDANPFLHLFEILFYLAGRDDVFFMKQFAKRMEQFSDDGKTFHGSYGRRWRSWFKDGKAPIDQIQIIINTLKNNPDDRRCVLQMWDVTRDLGKKGVDFPCNTHAYLSINKKGSLDMTVCQRSGDIIWGVYGANAVHFSGLQEYIAVGIGVKIGNYRQVTNDFHAYLDVFDPLRSLSDKARDPFRTLDNNPYTKGLVSITPIVDTPIKEWTEDLMMWMNDPFKVGLRSNFFLRVATPMYEAHLAYRKKEYDRALEILNTQIVGNGDWKIASIEWIQRRKKS